MLLCLSSLCLLTVLKWIDDKICLCFKLLGNHKYIKRKISLNVKKPHKGKRVISPSLSYIHDESKEMHWFKNNNTDWTYLKRNIVHVNNKVSKSLTSKFNTALNFDF